MKFENLIKDFVDTTGATLATAVAKVARMYPEAHEDYLKRLKEGKAESINKNPLLKARRGDFEARVKQTMYKYNITDMNKAMFMAKNHYPKEYEEFVARVEKKK